MKISINRVAKIEGHGSFQADIERGKIKDAFLKIQLGARFVEGIITRRKYTEAPIITSRICGICSVAHNITSIKALESALKLQPPLQAVRLRELLTLSEVIQSHAAHIFLLSLSDFYGYKSDIDLVKKFPDLASEVFKIRTFGNRLKEVIGGRSMHLVSSVVGGFTKEPSIAALKELEQQSIAVQDAAKKLAEFVSRLTYPRYERETMYVGQNGSRDYSFYGGNIHSNHKISSNPRLFYNDIDETQRLRDPVKEAKYKDHVFMVGALSRINLNHKNLNREAKQYLKSFPHLICNNIFYNTFAQAIELVHAVAESKKILNKLRSSRNKKIYNEPKIKAGVGIGSTEAPRGTLYHFYDINKHGYVTASNIITPTAQFLPNMEQDLKEYLKNNASQSLSNKKDKIKMLIRAYDPCLTCATH